MTPAASWLLTMAVARRPPGFGEWYDIKQGDTGDAWHRTIIDPGLFARLGKLSKGTRVLDLGCGNGYIARRLARRGARVIGVDASGPLIQRARAREAAHPLGIRYRLSDAADLSGIPAASVDVVVANMSLMDIADGAGAIQEVGRVLRSGGRFVATISHPCFDVDTRSAWVIEPAEGGSGVYRKVTAYRRPHSDIFPWKLEDGSLVETVGYHRSLGWYCEHLRGAGFVLVALDEPAPTSGFQGRRVRREWIEEIPLHLVFEARREAVPRSRRTASPRSRAATAQRRSGRRPVNFPSSPRRRP